MQKRKPPKKKRKFRLLLDSAFAKPRLFPRLLKKANVAHIVHTYGYSPQIEDKLIYQVAMEEKRIVITHDDDFKRLVKPKKAGVIITSPYLTNQEFDRILSEFITGKDPDDFMGKIVRIEK